MTATNNSGDFARATGKQLGYAPAEVDEFLARARSSFESARPTMTSDDVREVSFSFEREGYVVSEVDGALARLEDVFAERKRQDAIEHGGVETWVSGARDSAQEILARLSRERGQRFRRVGLLSWGYRVEDVDALADELVAFFQSGGPISVERIRNAAFRMSRRGYDEAQVDAVMDATIAVLLAVRPAS